MSVELTNDEINKLSYIKCDSTANSSTASTATTSKVKCNLYGYNKKGSSTSNNNLYIYANNTSSKNENKIYEGAREIEYKIYTYYYGSGTLNVYAILDDEQEILLYTISASGRLTNTFRGHLAVEEFLLPEQLDKFKAIKLSANVNSIASTASTSYINCDVY